MSQKPAKALAYALLIWFVGFAWGTGSFYDAGAKEYFANTLCLALSGD